MKNAKKKAVALALAVLALVITGCIVSGTFTTEVLIVNADFNNNGTFYYYMIDLTEDDVWEDHSDKLEFIDHVGFEMWFSSSAGSNMVFDAYLDNAGDPLLSTPAEVEANATQVLDGITLTPGDDQHITYGQSFKYITNFDTMRDLVETGGFRFYGISSEGSGSFTIDSVRVVITFTASES